MSEPAEDPEAAQLRASSDLVDHVGRLLSNGKVSERELRFSVEALAESLTEVLTIAVRQRGALKVKETGE